MIIITGLIVKLSTIIVALAGGSLFLAMILVLLSSYVLGMGWPVAAAYVLLAATAAPALEQLGTSLFAAHMIILWFSQDSTITPPVCMTAFVAARVANAPPMKTGWHSVLMAKALYTIPFVFNYGNLLDDSIPEVLFDFATLFAFFALMPIVIEGWWVRRLHIVERGVLAISTVGFLIAAFVPTTDGLPWLVGSTLAVGATLIMVRKTDWSSTKQRKSLCLRRSCKFRSASVCRLMSVVSALGSAHAPLGAVNRSAAADGLNS